MFENIIKCMACTNESYVEYGQGWIDYILLGSSS